MFVKLVNLIKEVFEHSDHDFELRTNYLGRGMYDKSCVGVVGPSEREIIKLMVQVSYSSTQETIEDTSRDLEENFNDLMEELFDYKVDNMGRDMIVYWPELEDI